MLDPRQACNFRRKRRLVDADDMRTHLLQCPAPAPWAAAEIETPFPWAGIRSGSAPPEASDKRGSAVRCDLRQSGSRRSETRWCNVAPRASSRHRAKSISRAEPWVAAFRRRAASLRPWGAVLGSRWPAGRVWARRGPSCVEARAALPPRPKSRRSRSRTHPARHWRPVSPGAAAPMRPAVGRA